MKIKDLIIVEIASVLAGPSVGMFFAELGAKVIKIESKPTGGDVTRSWKLPSEKKDSIISAYFSSVNYNKDYYFYDFNNADDLQKTLDFISIADVLITNFKYGDDLKFNLNYERIKIINPNLIYGSISGFGEKSDRVAYDLILQAESGFMSMNGSAESGPIKMPVALIDILAGHQLKEGILIALLQQATNGGAKVTVSLFDAAIASLANQASNFLMTGHIAKPLGSLHPNIAPYGEIFTTANNAKVTFAIGSQKQFRLFLRLLGLESLENDNRFIDNASRVLNRKELAIYLQGKIEDLSLSDILDYCHQHFVPVAEIKDLGQVLSEPEVEKLVLEEVIEKVMTRRVKTVAFKIQR